jgi:hypothetical protein
LKAKANPRGSFFYELSDSMAYAQQEKVVDFVNEPQGEYSAKWQYTKIPKEIYPPNDLTWVQRVLWSEIKSYETQEGGICRRSNRDLAIRMGLAEKTIAMCLTDMRVKKFIYDKVSAGKGRVRELMACLPQDFEKEGRITKMIASAKTDLTSAMTEQTSAITEQRVTVDKRLEELKEKYKKERDAEGNLIFRDEAGNEVPY